MSQQIPLFEPDIRPEDMQAVMQALKSTYLTMGPRLLRFEEMVAERTGRRHAIAVSSAAGGLHTTLAALGIGPGDQVVTTPLSFIAQANAIVYTGATPVFVDIDPITLGMDIRQLEQAITDRTKAIIGVELFGNPCHIDKIAAIAQQYELPLIEDCSEGFGGIYKTTAMGSFGRAGVFSFNVNRQLCTAEGGMIVTDDDCLAELCRSLRNQGRTHTEQPGTIENRTHEHIGFNYRMNEMQAALGIAQLERFDEIIKHRQHVAAMYFEYLGDLSDIVLPTVCDQTQATWFCFTVRLASRFNKTNRDRIIKGMERHDIQCQARYAPIHLQPAYCKRYDYQPGDFPMAESVAQRMIALPFFNRMDRTHVELVALTLKLMIQRELLLIEPQTNDPTDDALPDRMC